MVTINNYHDLKSMIGAELGVSSWYEITQDEVNRFADVTGDHQWIHIDRKRAEELSPYKATVAHGFFHPLLGY